MDETTRVAARDGEQRRWPWWVACAGMLASAASAWLGCYRFLNGGSLSSIQLFLTGVGIVTLPALEGAAVAALLWHFLDNGRLSYGRLVLACGVSWILLPPIVLLIHLGSWWAALIMILAAAMTAPSLRRLIPAEPVPSSGLHEQRAPFGMLPVSYSGIWLTLAIAAAIECAAIPLAIGRVFATGLLLSAAIFALLWQWASSAPEEMRRRRNDRGSTKLALAFLFAILISSLALTPLLGGGGPFRGRGSQDTGAQARSAPSKAPEGVADLGYKGIILWPVPKKKDVIAPAPMSLTLATSPNPKSVVIPFDGPYWYFQVPYRSPGKHAHTAHGDPTGVNIRSTGALPLLMEAHQSLGSPVDLACCRSFEVDIRNGDNIPGKMLLGLILTDSHSLGSPSLALGAQAVVSSEPGHFVVKSSPVEERLRYVLPARRDIRRFDQITVIYFPAPDRAVIGAKIAIQQFVLLPR